MAVERGATAPARTNVAARMGRWSAHHRKAAIVGWLVFVVVAFVLGGVVGTKQLTDADAQPGEAGRAARISAQAGFDRGDPESVLVQSTTLKASDPAFAAAVQQLEHTLGRLPGVADLRSPYRHATQISKDGHSALIGFRVGATPGPAASIATVLAAVQRVAREHPRLTIGEYGDASANKAIDDTDGRDFHRAELLSIPLTLAILLFGFGALVAAGIPVLLALSAVLAALGLLAWPSHVWPVDDSASSVILLIGLAVGVDYTLFYIRREREERALGTGAEAALAAAAATSGRAVLVSGLTVLIAMAGLFVTGEKELISVGVGTMLVVATAMAGSLTVLPALLSKLGDGINRGRLPFLGFRRQAGESRVFGALVDRVMRRPVLSLAVAGGALVVLALPAFALHTNNADETALPQGLEITKTYERLQHAFPGDPQPAYVVVKAADVRSREVRGALGELGRRALATGEMRGPVALRTSRDGTTAALALALTGSGTDARSEHALSVLRERLVPDTIGRIRGAEVVVGGLTAQSKDFNDLLKRRAPLVFAFVLGLAFVLLTAAFRSVVVAAKAIVLNLLSVGAAYGLLVAVFQWGWGESLLGFRSTHGIVSWLPLFLFVVLFGLSMDYHVFILTRVREAVDRGVATDEAVAHAIRTTAGVVTNAALVMVGVFSVFATLSQMQLKQLGVGLGAAILIDATIVRAVVLPAAMKLLGRRNWYLPQWLQWLPHIHGTTVAVARAES
jgi:RND superfamily putative drug exporter